MKQAYYRDMDAETNARFERIEHTLKDTTDILNGAAKVILGLAEKTDRIHHHLDILAELVTEVIRDRRYRDLEQRVQRLEDRERAA